MKPVRLSLAAIGVTIVLPTVDSMAETPVRYGKTASTQALLVELQGAGDEKRIEIILWELGRAHKLNVADHKLIIPFLDHKNSSIFSAAAECLHRTALPEVMAKLEKFKKGKDPFRAFRAATILLEHHADDSGFVLLRKKLLAPSTPLSFRRDLAGRFIDFQGKDAEVLRVYVRLLEDGEQWVRYNAVSVLREETGQRFVYDFRRPTSGDGLTRWQAWASKMATTWHPDRSHYNKPVAGLGVNLSYESRYPTITRVVPGLAAAEAGLQVGDALMAVNGDATEGKTAFELTNYELTGASGSVVHLTIERAGKKIEVGLKRKELAFPSNPFK